MALFSLTAGFKRLHSYTTTYSPYNPTYDFFIVELNIIIMHSVKPIPTRLSTLAFLQSPYIHVSTSYTCFKIDKKHVTLVTSNQRSICLIQNAHEYSLLVPTQALFEDCFLFFSTFVYLQKSSLCIISFTKSCHHTIYKYHGSSNRHSVGHL